MRGTKDPDDVRDVSYPDSHPRLAVSHGNASKIIGLPIEPDEDRDVEIPIDVEVRYFPMNAPPHVKTVQDLIDDVGDYQELVADGGQEIEAGDVVSHEERGRHRVARVNESHVEIYRLGDGSQIVPLSSVEAIPGAVAADGGDR